MKVLRLVRRDDKLDLVYSIIDLNQFVPFALRLYNLSSSQSEGKILRLCKFIGCSLPHHLIIHLILSLVGTV